MKIVLGVHHYPPTFVGGVELVAERMARSLVERGHTVEVICVEAISAAAELTVQSDWQDGVLVHRLGLPLTDRRELMTVRFEDPVIEDWCTAYFRRTDPDLFHSLSSYVLTASAIGAAHRLDIPTIAGLDDYWYFCPQMTFLRSNGERCTESASPSDCAWCLMADSRRYKAIDSIGDRFGVDSKRLGAVTRLRSVFLDRGLEQKISDRQVYLEQILQTVDTILTPAPMIRDLLETRPGLGQKAHLLEHGLDVRQWRNLQRVPRNAGVRFGYLGQILPSKGVHVLIEAFQRLAERGAAAELHIHGDLSRFPKYASRLRSLADGNPRIKFHGPYRHAEVERVLTEIDVLVFPSNWFEILGIVILEAFQSGVPVVASRLPNHAYHVRHEIDGLLFEANDVVDLARQLERLIQEPKLRAQLASNIGVVRTFEAEMLELQDIYDGMANRRSDPGPFAPLLPKRLPRVAL